MATCMSAGMASSDPNKSFWNREFSKPVTCNLAVFPTWTQCEVLRSAKRTLSSCLQCLRQQQQLASEFFILNRLTYMKHGQLRREKSFQGLKQIRSCVQKFFALRLEKSVKEMNSHFEDALVEEGIRGYLPSRQMWEHLLTKFLGAAALLANTASRCAAVFLHVHRHLTAGMLIPANLVFLSMLSRIWACCQGLCRELQTWYQTLQPVTDVLRSTEIAWLPEGASLPDDLAIWLTEQGFSFGLDIQKKEGGDEDSLAALMAKYQKEEQTDDDDMSSQPADYTLPLTVEEDLGDPVDISEVEMGAREEGPAILGDPDQSLPVRTKTGLKEKILTASTVADLQLILKKFQKKFPQSSTSKKIKKCSNFLADLQLRSQVLAEKDARISPLLAKGRKKLFSFFKVAARMRQTGETLLNHDEDVSKSKMTGEKPSLCGATDKKKQQKNSKSGKNVTENEEKSHSVSEIKSKKKHQKNGKRGKNVTDNVEKPHSVSETKSKKKHQKNGKSGKNVTDNVEKSHSVSETKSKKKHQKNGKSGKNVTDNVEKPHSVSETKSKKKHQKNGKSGKNVTDNVEKSHSVSETKTKKKQKENIKSGKNVTDKKRRMDAASADLKNSLACRKRKKNDPVNNQVQRKKRKARKV